MYNLQNGWTPLMQASQDGDLELVKILTKAEGVEIDHQSKVIPSLATVYYQATAINTASQPGQISYVRVQSHDLISATGSNESVSHMPLFGIIITSLC